ncbi:hypothetical protein CEXT_596941 [Caerostris extrusa]|uniref:DNA-directed RNA polymerase n=1 Tax=Caerostris extrusa TaxID=172846 RepID=A0AAV4PLA0_CAEEX|nr:hypothetical protein CEXT_596941 [Caerostris extrusa]
MERRASYSAQNGCRVALGNPGMVGERVLESDGTISPKTKLLESIRARKTRKHTVQVKTNNAVFGKENTNQYMTHKVVRSSEIPFLQDKLIPSSHTF